MVLSSGWDIMDFVKQLQKLAAGNVAFATIPVLDESGWSDDGMQSVVRVDPHQVQDWVAGLLRRPGQGQDRAARLRAGQDHRQCVNDTDINGLAAAVSEVLSGKGFATGEVGNNDAAHVTDSQVQAAKADDLGAQAVAKELGGLPVVANASVPPGSVRVVLATTTPARVRALDGGPSRCDRGRPSNSDTGNRRLPAPSPILTAGVRRPGVRQLIY